MPPAAFQRFLIPFRLYHNRALPHQIISCMAKNNLLYLCSIAALFFAFIYLVDSTKLKAEMLESKVSYDALQHHWVVAEAKDIKTGKDLTTVNQAKVYHFLSSGGFVELENKVILKTGSWKVLNNRLTIKYDIAEEKEATYQAELVRPEELLLLQGNLQLRLLRLPM